MIASDGSVVEFVIAVEQENERKERIKDAFLFSSFTAERNNSTAGSHKIPGKVKHCFRCHAMQFGNYTVMLYNAM